MDVICRSVLKTLQSLLSRVHDYMGVNSSVYLGHARGRQNITHAVDKRCQEFSYITIKNLCNTCSLNYSNYQHTGTPTYILDMVRVLLHTNDRKLATHYEMVLI